LEIEAQEIARVVIDGRSGVVVLGGDVRISPVAVAVGSLVVKIREAPVVVQPPPLSPGETREVPWTEIEVIEEEKRLVPIRGASVGELVNSLNRIGATPREIISVLQAIKAAGALKAKLEVL
ncbi:MAG TPA: flagellar biosynthesis protein FlgA, partial [Aquificaceae bacterium]|nr:flagellar biosynthesis protein FlgA [Aquificaceae bacterium]